MDDENTKYFESARASNINHITLHTAVLPCSRTNGLELARKCSAFHDT
jgi:hypothetical protein